MEELKLFVEQMRSTSSSLDKVKILKQQSERDGKVAQRLDSIERELDNIHRMHNGSHPPTQNKSSDK